MGKCRSKLILISHPKNFRHQGLSWIDQLPHFQGSLISRIFAIKLFLMTWKYISKNKNLHEINQRRYMHNWPSWIEHFWGLLVWYLWYLERLFTSIKCKWKALVGLFDILSDFQLKSTLCQSPMMFAKFSPIGFPTCCRFLQNRLQPVARSRQCSRKCSDLLLNFAILQKDKKILFLCNRPSWFYRMTRKILFGKPVLHILNFPAVEFSAQDITF